MKKDEEQHEKQIKEEVKAEERENETQREGERERMGEGGDEEVDKEADKEAMEKGQRGNPLPRDSVLLAETQDPADEPLPVIVVRMNGDRIAKENGATDIPFSETRKRKAPVSNGNVGRSISIASRRSSRLKTSDQDVSKEPLRPVTRHSPIASVVLH
jgi:hypothetical protein